MRILFKHPGTSSYHDNKMWVRVDPSNEHRGLWLDPTESIAVVPSSSAESAVVVLTQEQHTLALLALAGMALERPDMEEALDKVAAQMGDNGATLMEKFKELRRDALRLDEARGLTPEQRRSAT
jgi:hypothetical protein